MTESQWLIVAGESYEVIWTEDGQEISDQIGRSAPKWITYDTETSGLHIKKDKPFWGAVAWDGMVYVFPTTPDVLQHMKRWAQLTERVYAHNTTFDMHMTANIMGDDFPLGIKNWGDTMGLCRLSFEAISNRDGGDSLALKEVSRKYIDPNAGKYETEVKLWLGAKEIANRKILQAMLKGAGYTWKKFQELRSNDTLPDEIVELYQTWEREYPKPTYQDVPREIMLPYLAVDVILTNILVRKALPVVAAKAQSEVMEAEFALIPVVYKMARIGLKVDRDYLLQCRDKLDAYIEDLNRRMCEIGGAKFSVNQHKFIKDLYTERLGKAPESVDKKFMAKQKAKGDKLAEIITKLRTLEKWRSTYIERILERSEYDGRFYTSLDQFNPVSGRFSGDLQQQPKKALYHHETNEELFHPRKAFLVGSSDYKYYFMDFSQVELRFQAHYTLAFGGDLNMCRAYCPYRCRHYLTGEVYRFETEEEKDRWSEKDADGVQSAWVIPETGERWSPTDIHGASTRKALTLMGTNPDSLSESDFAMWRGLGKGVNFAKNYGVGIRGAAEQFGLEESVARALCEGYNLAFPGVLTYQRKVEQAMHRGFAVNLYGRRYYLNDSNRFYKVANYLIQGSCASDLKDKMLLIDKMLDGTKSCMILCIHDEIVFQIHNDETHLIPQIKSVMEYTPKVKIPIVAEIEYTETNWGEKHKYH